MKFEIICNSTQRNSIVSVDLSIKTEACDRNMFISIFKKDNGNLEIKNESTRIWGFDFKIHNQNYMSLKTLTTLLYTSLFFGVIYDQFKIFNSIAHFFLCRFDNLNVLPLATFRLSLLTSSKKLFEYWLIATEDVCTILGATANKHVFGLPRFINFYRELWTQHRFFSFPVFERFFL